MVPNESALIRTVLAALPSSRIAVIGSGAEDYYRKVQPYIWTDIYEPFQGVHEFVNFDLQKGPGIDVTVKSLDDFKQKTKFDCLLGCSLLEHVDNPKAVLTAIYEMVKAKGSFLFSGPGEWPYHEDPIDNMLRFDSIAKWRVVLPFLYDIKSFIKLEPFGPGYATMVICRKAK